MAYLGKLAPAIGGGLGGMPSKKTISNYREGGIYIGIDPETCKRIILAPKKETLPAMKLNDALSFASQIVINDYTGWIIPRRSVMNVIRQAMSSRVPIIDQTTAGIFWITNDPFNEWRTTGPFGCESCHHAVFDMSDGTATCFSATWNSGNNWCNHDGKAGSLLVRLVD
jgi:hypothetical protein